MATKSQNKLVFSMMAFSITLVFCMLAFTMCNSNSSKTEEETAKVDDETFYATQPLKSGLYDADYYDIQGANPRKGHFDGRIYFSLSPELSALYVFENGNRTKIDQIVSLKHPFEKNDSGIFVSVDAKDLPVSINTDSTYYVLSFQKGADQYKFNFNPKPRHTGTAVEILEKMNAQKKK